MHRIDTDGNMDNRFYDGDSTGPNRKEATVIDAAWLNAVQEELCHLIEHMGGQLSKQKNDQLVDSVGMRIISMERRISELEKIVVGP